MIVLDFADSEIRAMVLKKKTVQLVTTLPLEPGWIKDGVVTEPAALAGQLKQFLTSNHIAEAEVMGTISGLHSIYRMVNIPRVPEKLLQDAVNIELEKNMPVALDELYTSWQAINISQEEIALCLLGVRREVIDSMVNALRTAGLRPLVLEPRPLAVARLAEDPHAIIIDAQPTSFDIIIILGSIPVLVRTVPFSAEDVYGRTGEVKDELERTLNFYNAMHKEAQITPQSRIPIILNGELPGLAEATGYRSRSLTAPLPYTELDLTKYSAAAGLAMRVLRGKGSNTVKLAMNAIPEMYLPTPRPIGQVMLWLFVIASVIAFFFLAARTIDEVRETSQLQAQVERLQPLLTARMGSEKAIQLLKNKLDAATAQRDVFKVPVDAATAQRAMVIGDIRTITTSITSSTLKLEKIVCNDKAQMAVDAAPSTEIEIRGTATSEATVLDYFRRLRDSGRFSRVTIKNLKQVEYNQWQFSLQLLH